MSRILSLSLLLLLSASTAWGKAEKVKQAALPNGLVVHEYKLKNGLQILLAPDHSAPVANFQIWFRVGSASERLDPRLKRTGLAHFFEHMMFRGTKAVPNSSINKIISEAGSPDSNATTWFDRTNYFQSVPKEKLELIFKLESDRMTNLIIDEKSFKTELGAVFGELKMRNDRASTVAYEKAWDIAYEKSPYRYPVIGTVEELNTFTVEDALYFYRTYYAPNNATIILIGDFTVPQALALTEKYFGKMARKKLPELEFPTEPEQTTAKKVEISHPLTNSNLLYRAYRIPESAHPDMAALEMIGSILTTGDGSILEQELVQTGYASRVGAGPSRNRYSSIFTIGITMGPGKPDSKAESAVDDALERLREGKLTEPELDRAKNQFLLYAYTELFSHRSIATNLGDGMMATGNFLHEFEMHDRVKNVTVADVQRVAKTYLVKDRMNHLRVVPAPKAPKAEKGNY